MGMARAMARRGHEVSIYTTNFNGADDLDVPLGVPVDGTTAVLDYRMVHEDKESLYHFFDRHNKYSDWESIVQYNGSYFRNEDAQPFLRRYLKPLFARLPFKPFIAFFFCYVVKMGFLDGRAGFDFAVSRGVHFWQIQMKHRELVRDRGPAKK
jgi:hypothetical protein